MHDDPYKPPDSRLDRPARAIAPDRPRSAAIAVRLLYAAVVASILTMVVQGFPRPPGQPNWFGPVVGAATVAVNGGIYFAIGRRQRWARLLFTVLFVAGLVPTWVVRHEIARLFSEAPIYAVNMAFQTLVQLIAIVLLFTPESNAWFRKGGGSGVGSP